MSSSTTLQVQNVKSFIPFRRRRYCCYVCGKKLKRDVIHSPIECPMRNQRIQFPGAITPIWKKGVPLIPDANDSDRKYSEKFRRLFISVHVDFFDKGGEYEVDIEMMHELMTFKFCTCPRTLVGNCIIYPDIKFYEELGNDTVVLFVGIQRLKYQFRFQSPVARSIFIRLINVMVSKSISSKNDFYHFFVGPILKL